MRLKTRLFILLTLFALLLLAGTVGLLRFSLQRYQQLILRRSDQLLSLATALTEAEVLDIETLSFNMVVDSDVQETLEAYGASEDSVEQSFLLEDVGELLLDYLSLHANLVSIHVLLPTGAAYHVDGHLLPDPVVTEVSEFAATARSAEGRHIFAVSRRDPEYLLALRDIRQKKDLSLESLGVLALRFSLSGIVQRYQSFLPEFDATLAIREPSGGWIVAPPTGFPVDATAEDEFLRHGRVHSVRRFVTPNEGWEYIHFINFQDARRLFTGSWIVIAIIVTALYVVATSTAMRLSRTVLSRLEDLKDRMIELERSDYDPHVVEEAEIRLSGVEEIDVFTRDVNAMLQKIQSLMRDNARKIMLVEEHRYRALRAQINPHFLYNTLESITWTAREAGNDDVARMTRALGTLLRKSLSGREQVWTVGEEIDAVQEYVFLQQQRFGDRLNVCMAVEAAAANAEIPVLTLQPVLENSIKHGLEQTSMPERIVVTGRVCDGDVILTVSDDGPGMRCLPELERPLAAESTGMGLWNIHTRLRHLFGERGGVTVNSSSAGTDVTIHIPRRPSGA